MLRKALSVNSQRLSKGIPGDLPRVAVLGGKSRRVFDAGPQCNVHCQHLILWYKALLYPHTYLQRVA